MRPPSGDRVTLKLKMEPPLTIFAFSTDLKSTFVVCILFYFPHRLSCFAIMSARLRRGIPEDAARTFEAFAKPKQAKRGPSF